MKTIPKKDGFQTLFTNADRVKLGRIVSVLRSHVRVEPIGQYRTMNPGEVWLMLVGQVCVMGSAQHMERIHSDPMVRAEFEKSVSLYRITHQHDQVSYLAKTLRHFSATRFPTRGAENLASVLHSPGAFRGQKLVLFEDLSHKDDANQIRDKLIERCPIFRLKSASDFMISVGLSNDVIALDTRIVGTLQKHFAYNLKSGQIQSHPRIYSSLEAALRDFCQEQDATLALLDRLLFRFSSLGAIELVMKYPELFDQFG